jgi:C-terminal processing protease CtpA/Prc
MIKKITISFLLSFIIFTIAQNSNAFLAQQTLTQQNQKEIIDKLIILLEDNYIFPEKGKEIGVNLLKRLNDGNYRKLSDPQSFARQITFDLQYLSHDKHLSIEYDPQRVKELRTEKSNPTKEEVKEIEKRRYEKQRRNNFGFRKVEILEGNIGYLDLRFFRSTNYAANVAVGALNFLSNSDAIIIDLRNNYGGGASMYLLLISYFFDSNMIHLSDIKNRLSNSTKQFWTLPYIPGKRLPDLDLYILTSNRTFSAAEQFTYDLQCLKRAVIVGQPTGGGAHMATRLIINDDFYVFMPFAGAINPITKTNWENVGVKPDVEVEEEKVFDTAYILALKNLEKKTDDQNWKEKLSSLINNIEMKKDL